MYVNTNYKNKDVSGQDFSGLDLSYANFKGANVSRCSFVGTNLEGANFVGANVDKADFTDATCYYMNDRDSTGKGKWNNAKCYGSPKHREKPEANQNKPDKPDKDKE